MAQTFNTILSFVKSTSRKDRRKGVGSLSVSAVAGGGVGSVADSATQAWVRDNFVDKTTEQEISVPKIFSQGIKIGDVSLFKHPDGYVYLDETLVLKGGVVMYGNSSGVDVPSIFDSLPIDGYTIKRDGNGALYVDETALSVSGGGGGGVADSVHWNNVTGKPSWIGSTKPTYKYSEIEERPDLSVYAKLSDIPSLNGYATQNWVENKGYLLATTASNTYQPKITTTNKLAYSLISGTPDLSVYAKLTDIPSLNGYATQTWVEGYSAKWERYIDITNNSTFKSIGYGTTGYGWPYNGPAIAFGANASYNHQIQSPADKNTLYHRAINNGVAKDWVMLLDSGNLSSFKLSQFTDDVVAGKYLPLAGGTISGDLDINSQTDTTIRYFRMWYYGEGRKNRGMIRVNENNVALSYYSPTDGVYHPLTIGRDGFKYNTYDILHSGNYSNLLAGGIINGSLTATSFIGNEATFSSKVVIGTIPVYESADGTLYVDANIVFRGGVAMHGNTTTTVNEE